MSDEAWLIGREMDASKKIFCGKRILVFDFELFIGAFMIIGAKQAQNKEKGEKEKGIRLSGYQVVGIRPSGNLFIDYLQWTIDYYSVPSAP